MTYDFSKGKKSPMIRKNLSARVTPELYDKVTKIAEKYQVTRSYICALILTTEINKIKI